MATGMFVVLPSVACRFIFAPAVCKYAALSYVWGDNPTHVPTPNKFSQVVVDAIEVTLLMKLRYLWVDRHCINSNDEADKHHQISQMGNIYANAEITIIAAAGTDPTYGLPGISRPRKQHPDGFPYLSHQIKESVWASRGWTYQEGFLSPRKLVFTDYEASYLCDTICLAEHAQDSMSIMARGVDDRLKSFTLSYSEDDKIIYKYNMYRVHQMIIEYSRRQLGYPSDALHAIKGVIKLLEIKAFTLIWGIPIHYNLPMIHWYHEHPTERRPGFPSWSFLGWNGPIQVHQIPTRYCIHFKASLGDGENLLFGGKRMASIASELRGLGENAPRYLHLTGYVVDLPLKNIQQTKSVQNSARKMICGHQVIPVQDTAPSSGIYASLKMRPGLRILVKTNIDESNFTACHVLGFFIGTDLEKDIDPSSRADFLLLRRSGTCYERIGYLAWRLRRFSNTFYDYGDSVYFIESDDVSDEIIELPRTPLWAGEAEKRTVVVG
ncbi:heterokaryon incompatibility protein-domain-containing protein [Daldinia decipiens]|uniref:heterokaryon incompatibility protein-domain-containing protein n=1 Tax=Daldinia decipiens TaxID=326647 RepID=UPI0020C3D656|nr:heterokaryon incompatibility protein-domain-containing protein [Daldinia decipiens]KAI1653924.1 heterokaryon incompatibility protein-domain-containing protein [Daldinia decipiens]